MKNLIKSILILSLFTFVATSCSDDEQAFAKPVISNLEVGGHHDEKEESKEKEGEHEHEEGVGHIGEDLHIEAEIVAEGKIAYIEVKIHKKEGGAELVEKKFIEGFVGLKNTKFHKHVDIPTKTKDGKDVAEGEYHFHLKVVDQQGQENEKEVDLKLEKEDK